MGDAPVARGSIDDMNGGAWILVSVECAIHDGHVVDRKRAFVGMLVSPKGDVDSVFVHEIVEAVSVDAGESRPDHVESGGAMLVIHRVTVRRSVAHDHEPRLTRQILGPSGVLQIGDQPVPLKRVLGPTEAGVIEELCLGW